MLIEINSIIGCKGKRYTFIHVFLLPSYDVTTANIIFTGNLTIRHTTLIIIF